MFITIELQCTQIISVQLISDSLVDIKYNINYYYWRTYFLDACKYVIQNTLSITFKKKGLEIYTLCSGYITVEQPRRNLSFYFKTALKLFHSRSTKVLVACLKVHVINN